MRDAISTAVHQDTDGRVLASHGCGPRAERALARHGARSRPSAVRGARNVLQSTTPTAKPATSASATSLRPFGWMTPCRSGCTQSQSASEIR